MVAVSLRTAVAAALALTTTATSALHVSPGSPCEASCGGSSSNGNNNTLTADIVCHDEQYNTTDAGKQYKQCMTCLQKSTYSNGDANDQTAFLYNMRLSVDFCIFGVPASSEIGSNVCATSEACGKMFNPWTSDVKNGSRSDEFAYCGKNDEPFGPCVDCVRADSSQTKLASYIVALQAGCKYRPLPSTPLMINDTIFADHVVSIVDPTGSSQPAPSGGLSTGAIVGIAIGGFVVVFLAVGSIIMCIRRRRNKEARLQAAHESSASYDFRCQTHLDPYSPGFDPNTGSPYTEHAMYWNEKQPYTDMSPLGQNPPEGMQNPALGIHFTHGVPTQEGFAASQENIGAAVSSPEAAVITQRHEGSVIDDYYTSPVSTTSMHSSAPFLSSPQVAYSPHPLTSSPLARQEVWTQSQPPIWESAPVEGKGAKNKGRAATGGPVETQTLQTSFPPPPKK